MGGGASVRARASVAVMTGDTDALRCPACGAEGPQVEPARASACLPFPPVETLLCWRCGNTGTRMRLRERTVVQWSRGG